MSAVTSNSNSQHKQQEQQQQQQEGELLIKYDDFKEEYKEKAKQIFDDSYRLHKVEKHIAAYIKKRFDESFGATWHVIVGQSYGTYVTHMPNNFIFCYLGKHAITVFRT
ncbi:MAG: hypothetical protein MHMPM18_000504 [Marteilia pararefringens]